MGIKNAPLEMTERQMKIIRQMIRSQSFSVRLTRRLLILIRAAEGASNYAIGKELQVHQDVIRAWRRKWKKHNAALCSIENGTNYLVSDRVLSKHILEIISDELRSGRPERITLTQKNQIVSLACEKPKENNIPISRWSLPILRQKILEKSIVSEISVSQVGKILKKTSAPQDKILVVRQNRR